MRTSAVKGKKKRKKLRAQKREEVTEARPQGGHRGGGQVLEGQG